MNVTRPVSAKILENAEGLGVPSERTVECRARELALIDGRDTPTEADLRLAFIELHGGNHYPLENADLMSADEMALLTASSISVPSLGHQTPRLEFEGGQSIGEELVAEGLDEALHDRMLTARHEIDLPEGLDDRP